MMADNRYDGMDIDQLISAFKLAAVKDVPGEGQEAAVDEINALKRAIAEHAGYMDLYRNLLSDPEPAVRYSAALTVKEADPNAALSVFKELRDGHYGLGALAWIEIRELRLLGYA